MLLQSRLSLEIANKCNTEWHLAKPWLSATACRLHRLKKRQIQTTAEFGTLLRGANYNRGGGGLAGRRTKTLGGCCCFKATVRQWAGAYNSQTHCYLLMEPGAGWRLGVHFQLQDSFGLLPAFAVSGHS